MNVDFDVIVIGSGAAGGTMASALAQSGRRTLLLERGSPQHPSEQRDEQSTLIEKRPYDSREIVLNDRPSRLYMGSGPGGGTSVYGAALMRPATDDFHPGKHYSKRLPKHLWDWPIRYEDLEDWFDVAERLYRVPGCHHDNPLPLNPVRGVPDNDPLPLIPVNERIVHRCREAELNPFRLPLGIESDQCLRCANCAGFLCPTGARRSSAQLVQEALSTQQPLTVIVGQEVSHLVRRPDGTVDGVSVVDLSTKATHVYRGHRYVLAAGAIGSPGILLRSGFDHPQIGRNYMMHYSPLVVGVFAKATCAEDTFSKQLGFADFYYGTHELREKMGIVQSLPVPGLLMLKKSGLGRVPEFVLRWLRRHMLPFVGIVEDLPNPNNRVECRADGRISLFHQFSDFDRARGAALARAMVRMLKIAGAAQCVRREMPSRDHVAHQCGTVRFGVDSANSVVDSNCRMFGHENLFVVDGSILPTSLGVGPSLTLIANSLRVADVLKHET